VQLETSNQIATRVSQLVVFGLPDDYFTGYRDEMRAVTQEQAAAAARRHVRPSEAQVVVVGDASQIAGPLDALGLGPLEVRRVQLGGGAAASQ
jgi:predicted Zn-dependent peptidase